MDLANRSSRRSALFRTAGGALLVAIWLMSSLVPAAPGPHPAIYERPATVSPRLAVDPNSWRTTIGSVTSFNATWVDPSPGCAISPYWFRWSIAGAMAEGWLSPTVGATVNFTAASVTSGQTVVLVRSAADLSCPGTSTAVVETAEANVTVIAPISIQNLSVGPNPVDPGGTVFLTGNVSGGEAPYSLRMAWGDGTRTTADLSSAGPFAVSHTYPAGSYQPGIVVEDSLGLLAQASVGEDVVSSSSLAIGIAANRTTTDIGVPVRMNTTVINAPAGSVTQWACLSAVRIVASSDSTEFSCAFSHAGPAEVTAEVLVPNTYDAVSTSLSISVEPLPTLVALTPSPTTEVGRSCLVAFNVSGGTPPFRLTWTASGASDGGVVPVATDGTVVVPIRPTVPGSFGIVALLADSQGAVVSNSTPRILVNPPLNDSTFSERTRAAAGEMLAVVDSITTGVPPFQWAVSPGSVPVNETTATGVLYSVGTVDWSGVFRAEGTTNVTVVLVDAAGGFTVATFGLGMVTPLAGNISLGVGNPPGPGVFSLDVSLTGGLPPFGIEVNASDGESWSRNLSSDGNFAWTFSPLRSGELGLSVVATDATGVHVGWNRSVEVAPAHSVPKPIAPLGSAPPDPYLAGAGLLVVAGVVLAGAWFHRRRRVRVATSASPDPVAVLREIIEPADGADRATVELLAEEAGIPLDVVRSTLDRLIGTGSIRSETSPDGEEVISWSATSSA